MNTLKIKLDLFIWLYWMKPDTAISENINFRFSS